jgi:hypothetical protein
MHNYDEILSHSELVDWAKQEVLIAVKNEKEGAQEPGDANYGVACYNSALKAFMSLSKDGHSGFSIGLTKNILNRLIDGRPLTPIDDVPEVWNDVSEYNGPDIGYKQYQCSRMSSLFKKEYTDGRVEYSDVDRMVCYNIDQPDVTYTSNTVSRIIDEMIPVTMPYYPATKRLIVTCDEFLVDPANGDFDTIGVLYYTDTNGDKITINRFFGEDPVTHKFVEIPEEEFNGRKAVRIREQ